MPKCDPPVVVRQTLVSKDTVFSLQPRLCRQMVGKKKNSVHSLVGWKFIASTQSCAGLRQDGVSQLKSFDPNGQRQSADLLRTQDLKVFAFSLLYSSLQANTTLTPSICMVSSKSHGGDDILYDSTPILG
jgi:hypothetical protein